MRLALLSNVTAEVLAGMLRDSHALWLPSGFGAWMETALAVPESLRAFAPEAVVLLLDSTHGAYDPKDADRAVAALEAALPRAAVLVPDLEDLFFNSRPQFFDERMWQLASMPWSLKGLRAIRDEIDRLLALVRGGRRKALALDFDNTLWEGVIGEDGVPGVCPRTDFQREIRALRERGVVLVGLSKNNPADVEPVWDDPRMVLKRDDFAALRIGWNDKAANLADVARTLNLGTDAFVFVDDDPVERAQMAARCPEVAVAEWPVTARRLARLYFPRLRLTDEDRAKTDQYRAEARRREASAGLSLDEYLKSLELRTEIHPVVEADFARVAQLSQKANQFNVCTNRYTADDIARFASDPDHLLLTLRAGDRFGDYGLVAFVHAARADGAATPSATWEIRDWVLSCRAMNRRLEFALERRVEELLAARGVTRLLAVWRRTARNEPVRELYERFGFTLAASTDAEKRYVRRWNPDRAESDPE